MNKKKIIILSVVFLSLTFLILDFLSYRVDKIVKNLIIDQGNQAFGINSKIDIELTPKIFIEAISAKKKTSSFGMNWKLDY